MPPENGFDFRLEKLRELAEHRRAYTRQRFEDQAAEEQAEQERLEQLETHKEDTSETLVERLRRGESGAALKDRIRYLDRLSQHHRSQVGRWRQALDQLESVRDELQEAVQREEILNNLREKALAAFQRDRRRQEQKALDEIGQRMNGSSQRRSGSAKGGETT